jgi:hypothetical protein
MTIGWENAANACVFYLRVVYRDFVPRTANLPDYETRMCFWYTPEKPNPVVGGPQSITNTLKDKIICLKTPRPAQELSIRGAFRRVVGQSRVAHARRIQEQ